MSFLFEIEITVLLYILYDYVKGWYFVIVFV